MVYHSKSLKIPPSGLNCKWLSGNQQDRAVAGTEAQAVTSSPLSADLMAVFGL